MNIFDNIRIGNPRPLVLALIVLVCSCMQLWGRTISTDEALKIAENFLRQQVAVDALGGKIKVNGIRTSSVGSSPVSTSLGLVYSASTSSRHEPAYYVFDRAESGGFIVVAADDRLQGVLGYTSSGSFQREKMPSNFEWWLGEYERQIDSFIISEETQRTSVVSSSSGESDFPAIDPLLTTRWNQNSPYNDMCPEIGGNKCVTGCVATAVAQIMKYYNYPEKGIGENSYLLERIGQISCDFSNIVFDWDNMLDEYDESSTEVQKEAVAQLMYACGVASNMNYGVEMSGAYFYDLPYDLQRFFGYSANTEAEIRDGYTDSEWESLIYNELRHKRPVLYSGGYASKSPHAFVCDGYSDDGFYHINWGWGGLCDGYFRLSALNPSSQGIGGSKDGYTSDQCIVMGLEPSSGDEKTVGQNFVLISEGGFSYEGDNRFKLDGYLFILYPGYYEIPLGIMVVSQDNGEEMFFRSNDDKILEFENDNDYTNQYFSVIPTGLRPGKYIVYPAYICPDGRKKRLRCPINESTSVQLEVADDGALTYTPSEPIVHLTLTDISFPKSVFQSEKVIASFICQQNGNLDYTEELFLKFRKKGENEYFESVPCEITVAPWTYKTVEIPVNIIFAPGDYEMVIANGNGQLYGVEPVEFTVRYLDGSDLVVNSISSHDFYPGITDGLTFSVSNPSSSDIKTALRLDFHSKDDEEKTITLYTLQEFTFEAKTTTSFVSGLFTKPLIPGSYSLSITRYDSDEELCERIDVYVLGQDEGLWYTIENQVAALGPAPESCYEGVVTIPESVIINEETYPVKRILNNAFENCSDLKTIFFQSPAMELDNATEVLGNLPEKAEIYVPDESFDGYQTVLRDIDCQLYSTIEDLEIDITQPVYSGRIVTLTIKPMPESKKVNPDFDVELPEGDLFTLVSISPIDEDGAINVSLKPNTTGTSEITVRSQQPNLKPKKVTVTVTKPDVTALILSEPTLLLATGSSARLFATIVPDDAEGTVVWSTSDPDIAMVDDTGLVTGISEGKATITAVCGSISATCEVTVEDEKEEIPPFFYLNAPQINLKTGESYSLEILVDPEEVEIPEIEWSSSDNSVATVDGNGIVRAIGEGKATISATPVDDSFPTQRCEVYVASVSGISNPSSEDLKVIGYDGKIEITGAPVNSVVEVYALSGTLVFTLRVESAIERICFSLPSGYYVVRIAGRSEKVII